MYVQRSIIARSVNQCCIKKQQWVVCVCVDELHLTINYIKILSVAQQCFNGKVISPATTTGTYIFM